MIFSFQLREAIAKHPEQTDDGLDPARRTAAGDRRHARAPGDVGWLGVVPLDETKSYKPGPLEAVGMSVNKNVEGAGLIFQTLWGLFTRETSPKQLMGPVAIAQLSGESAAARVDRARRA